MPLSTFLNGRDLATPRGLLFLSLSESATILTLTATDDTGGGASTTWGTAGTAVPCRIDPLGGNGRGVTGGRIDERSTHIVTVPPGTPVTASGRVVIANRGTFEVTATRDRTAEWSRTFEVVQAS